MEKLAGKFLPLTSSLPLDAASARALAGALEGTLVFSAERLGRQIARAERPVEAGSLTLGNLFALSQSAKPRYGAKRFGFDHPNSRFSPQPVPR